MRIAHHYLMHLLRDKLVASKSRIVFVSSGAIRNVPDVCKYIVQWIVVNRADETAVMEEHCKGGSGLPGTTIYCETKFIALLGAHWWRRQFHLAGNTNVEVVAVSPGLIPGTGLARGSGMTIPSNLPDAKSVPEGPYIHFIFAPVLPHAQPYDCNL